MAQSLTAANMATSKERQAAFRKRNAALGRFELRGIVATKEEQADLKPKIKLMLKELRKQDENSNRILFFICSSVNFIFLNELSISFLH